MGQSSRAGAARLLSAPHVVLQLLGACQDLATPSEDLQPIVLQDSGLCARILTAAAKTCPDRLDPSAPIRSALAGLGRPALRSLALQAAKTLIDTPLDADQTQFLRELWYYSQVAGALCRSLSEAAAYPAREEAQLTGMMLNIGMLALFSSEPERYPAQVGQSLGSLGTLGAEQAAFETDHRQVGTAMVAGWGLDSFMGEALFSLYLDPEACREAALLVRIARLGHSLCDSPLAPEAKGIGLATRLLALDSQVFAAAFQRALECYRPFSPFDNRQEECRQELARARRRLTSLVFSFAEQDGIRTELSRAGDPPGIAAAARSLYLRFSPASEMLLFQGEEATARFTGLPAPGQSPRIADLVTDAQGGNLVAEALRCGRPVHSFADERQGLSVFDRQLLGLCGSSGIAALPLQTGKGCPAVVVLGLGEAAAAEALGSPELFQLGRFVASRLQQPVAAGGISSRAPGAVSLRKVAHEIRTPLAIINNYMSGLREVFAGQVQPGVLDAVSGEINRVGEILAYYTEAENPAGREDPVGFQAPDVLARDVIASLAPTHFAPRRLEIVTDFTPGLAPLPVSPVAVRQILVNLLQNAAEALPEEGRIQVGSHEILNGNGEWQVVLSVEDDGPGIDEGLLGQLFSPVPSTKGDGHAGLGLHIVKGLADDIGARVTCQSRPGRGTRFELTIVRPPADHPDPETGMRTDHGA